MRRLIRLSLVALLLIASVPFAVVALSVASNRADAAPAGAAAPQAVDDTFSALATEILGEMVAIRSSEHFPEKTFEAAAAVAARLRAEGFTDEDVTLVDTGVANLVVRYRGTGARRPILVMAHMDVVDAEPDAWQADPYTMVEIDGHYYGRGTSDNKAGVATLVTNFIRLKREGHVPDRDIIMALTGDEETGMGGISHLANERKDLVDAAFALNSDSGGGAFDPNGEPQVVYVQMAEKRYQTFELAATNKGGHSSAPRADNAIYELARALVRLEQYHFPIEISDMLRESIRVEAGMTPGELGEMLLAVSQEYPDPEVLRRLTAESDTHNALLRTTCVATMLEAGHAENALPRSARATVNCRVAPGHSTEEMVATLREIIADDSVSVTPGRDTPASDPSSVEGEAMEAIGELVDEMWPGAPIAPEQSAYGTDGVWTRNAGIPTYGISGIFFDPDDIRAHGLDERVPVESFHRGVEFWYRLLKRLTS